MNSNITDKIVGLVGVAAVLYILLNKASATPPPTKYSCIGNTCIEDPNGIYNSLEECQLACTQPIKYSCTGTPNYQCIEDPNGIYNSLSECQSSCVAAPILSEIITSPSSISIDINRNAQFTTICKDQYSNIITCPTLTWKTNDPLIAIVDQSGLVTGVTSGTVQITASSLNGITGTSTITVTSVAPILTSISIIPTSATISLTSTQTITATCIDQFGNQMTCPILSWNRSNPAVASVVSTGINTAIVTGLTVGTTQITASY